eukprot:3757004-Rhodomonas_salina.1
MVSSRCWDGGWVAETARGREGESGGSGGGQEEEEKDDDDDEDKAMEGSEGRWQRSSAPAHPLALLNTRRFWALSKCCLLYTSDAADDM